MLVQASILSLVQHSPVQQLKHHTTLTPAAPSAPAEVTAVALKLFTNLSCNAQIHVKMQIETVTKRSGPVATAPRGAV